MTMSEMPLWVTVPGALLLVIGGLVTLIGSLGLLRLPDLYARMHGPSMGTTIGTASVLLVSLMVSSAASERPVIHELLITMLVVMSAPVSSMMLLKAALYRDVQRWK
jgi:monovalent cation/proton antiporter, MnhG/PhaG subunit